MAWRLTAAQRLFWRDRWRPADAAFKRTLIAKSERAGVDPDGFVALTRAELRNVLREVYAHPDIPDDVLDLAARRYAAWMSG